MVEEQQDLPESVGGLFDTAFALYGKRVALYAALAFAGFSIQGASAAIVYAFHIAELEAALVETVVNTIVDAFILGAVAIGVVADATGTAATQNQIITTTVSRWPTLIAVYALINIVMFESNPVAPNIGLGLFFLYILPICALWATVVLATVICSVDTTQPPVMRMIVSFGHSFRLALGPGNIGRTVILGLMILVPVLFQVVLGSQLISHHVAGADFWTVVPVDALLIGPFQAVFAVFYLDFVRRYNAAQASR
jgi:hypothetical protein